MKAVSRSATALVLLCVFGCRHTPPTQDPVMRMGLTETVLGRSLIENALTIANSWIDPSKGIRFAANWVKQDRSSKDIVPIYAISTLNAPATYLIAVPSGCRCIFVQPRAYED